MCDLPYGSYTPSRSPSVAILVDYVYDDLKELCRSVIEKDSFSEILNSDVVNEKDIAMDIDLRTENGKILGRLNSFEEDEERKRKDRLAKTGTYVQYNFQVTYICYYVLLNSP